MADNREPTGLGGAVVSTVAQNTRLAQSTPMFWSLASLPRIAKISRLLFATVILAGGVTGGISFINAYRWLDNPFPGFLVTPRMVVQDSGLPYWTGVQARLNYPDKVRTANGENLGSRRDLEEVLNATKVGDPIAYEIERSGRIMTISIATMRFSRF